MIFNFYKNIKKFLKIKKKNNLFINRIRKSNYVNNIIYDIDIYIYKFTLLF